jgi:hypothetical protein
MKFPFETIDAENVTTIDPSRALKDIQQQLDALQNLTTLVATPIMDQWFPAAHLMASSTTVVLAISIFVSLLVIGCKLYTKRRNTREQTQINLVDIPVSGRETRFQLRHTNPPQIHQSTPDMSSA